MREWTSGFVETNGIRLHYTRTGGEKPPLVLAHGVTDSGLCWAPLAEALQREYDLIMVDARGHGRSDAPAAGYDPATQAVDLAGVITGLGLTRPAVLGHSMGAVTALVLAGVYPDLPGSILLEDPPARWVEGGTPNEDANRAARMHEEAVARKAMPREALIAAQRTREPRWSEEELAPWADAKLQVSLDVMSVFDSSNPQTVDWAHTLARITCPVLLIVADPEQGPIVTAASATALRELVPQTEVARIADAGHSIRRDQFAQYVDTVRGFLVVHPPG